jgi:hypothetical protein
LDLKEDENGSVLKVLRAKQAVEANDQGMNLSGELPKN